MSTAPVQPPTQTSRPCGEIDCRVVNGRSSLVRCFSRAPLKLLTPSSLGTAASVVMSSFGGGLVAGDDVPIVAHVGRGAACVLATQSAGKAYRSDGRTSSQSIAATVEDGALLAVLPEPLCPFADARFAQRQTFDLAATGNLIWLDWFTSGRWARDERWRFRSLTSRTDVRIDGHLVLRESIKLDAESFDVGSPMRAGGFDCYATLAIVGPRLAAMADAAERLVSSVPVGRDHLTHLASCSRLDGHGIIVRVLGQAAQTVQQQLRPIVAALADVIGADPWARKW